MSTAAPEQAVVWACPQPHFSLDEIAFTLIGAQFHRIHLSGFLDRVAPEQLELVRSAFVVYKEIRQDIPGSMPFWPLGLPGWEGSWIAYGRRAGSATWVAVWRRESGTGPADEASSPPDRSGTGAGDSTRTLTISHLRGTPARPVAHYPEEGGATATWTAADGQPTVSLPRPNTAVLRRCAARWQGGSPGTLDV